MICDVFCNVHGADDLLFTEAGSRRFAFLDEPIQQRFRFWKTVELNYTKHPLELLDFQVKIIYRILDRGYCIADMPAEWIQRWKAKGGNEEEVHGGSQPTTSAPNTPAVEYIRPTTRQSSPPLPG